MAVRMLRNSERQSYKQCRHKWWWNFHERRQSVVPALALTFGDLVHLSLAAYYKPGRKRGPSPAKTFEKLYIKREDELRATGWYDEDRDWQDAGELGVKMLEGYVERWRDKDLEYEVIASEQTFQVRVKTPPFSIAGAPAKSESFWVVGTMDGVWRHLPTGHIIFPEHKTAKAIATDGLAMDEQAGTYWTYGPKWLERQGIIKPGEKMHHIVYNYLRKAAPDPDATYNAEGLKLNLPKKDVLVEEATRRGGMAKKLAAGKCTIDELMAVLGPSALQLGEVSKSQNASFFEREPVFRDEADRRIMHERILDEFMEMRRVEAGELAVIKNPGPQHMPNCRGCLFRDPCELHETGNDYEELLAAITQPWDPYDAHNKVERR
jgi:hypothetical protein